jgi:glucose-6-phosphate isomerase
VALTAAGRPNLTYLLPRISAHVLGQLVYLFEFQTALSGELYGIDAFDQPGVEAGKVAAYALMGRKGYERDAARLKKETGRRRAVV